MLNGEKQEKMRNKITMSIIGILFVGGILFFSIAVRECQPYIEEKIKQEEIVQNVIGTEKQENPMRRNVDFATLKKINQDIVGWLYIPQIEVDAPVLKGENNTIYLTRNFEGEYSPLGSIFTWAYTDEMLTDKHICLFGHNTASGQMFGRLNEFQDHIFMETNRELYLYTPSKTKKLQIETVFICENTNDIFQKQWNEQEGQIVTLATCVGYEVTAERLVVNCRVVEEQAAF